MEFLVCIECGWEYPFECDDFRDCHLWCDDCENYAVFVLASEHDNSIKKLD